MQLPAHTSTAAMIVEECDDCNWGLPVSHQDAVMYRHGVGYRRP
jgi:hypothetical protein